jgi:predicted membrane protein
MEATHTQSAPVQSIGKLMAGLFFTAAGLLLTADNLDLMEAEPYLELWPALLIALGVFKLLDAGSSRLASGVIILIGVWLLALNLEWIRFSIFELWPLVLIAAGVGFIVHAVRGERETRGSSGVAIFANRKTVETTRDYRGGNLVAVMGGQTIDLMDADITISPAVLDVFAWWGSVEIFVPDHWEVVSEVTPVMAGFELKRGRAAGDPNKRLIIRGAAVMAGIDVKARRNA